MDKSLSFLSSYVQKSLENGAKPYIPEHERTGILNVGSLRNEDQHDVSGHGLRFEAYELPKPSVRAKSPVRHASSTDLVPVPEPTYIREVQATSFSPASDAGANELKLRLEGVQKKWGKPTYSSSTPTTSSSSSQKPTNGATQQDGVGTISSQSRDASYSSRRSQVEVNPEKQRLAASIFGGTPSQTERRSSTGPKSVRGSSPAFKKSELVASAERQSEKAAPVHSPPPNLLDLEEQTLSSDAPSVDPFQQLEGLVGTNEFSSNIDHGEVGSSSADDLLTLYDTPATGLSSSVANVPQNTVGEQNFMSTLANPTSQNVNGGAISTHPSPLKKGPSSQSAREKHAAARQVGVTPSGTNPNLFGDLLG